MELQTKGPRELTFQHDIITSGGSRILQTEGRSSQNLGGVILIFWPIFLKTCRERKNNWPIWGGGIDQYRICFVYRFVGCLLDFNNFVFCVRQLNFWNQFVWIARASFICNVVKITDTCHKKINCFNGKDNLRGVVHSQHKNGCLEITLILDRYHIKLVDNHQY